MKSTFLLAACAAFFSFFDTNGIAAELEIGKAVPSVKLEGEIGSRVNGEAWSSDELRGHLHCLFYIDPEEKSANEPVEAAFKKAQFEKEKLKSVAIINMAAAWYPNSMIAGELEKKQKEFPHTVYVKDFKKELVKKWDLKDDSVNVVLIDKDGKVLLAKKGANERAGDCCAD